jgi:hypothetical protein
MATKEKITVIPFWTPELMDSVKKNDFRMMLSTPKVNLTGICIVKQVNGDWRGSIMNEFGVKILDFVSTPEKCKLVHVISFLDKWYIKKVIASDIQFMMEIDNPAYRIGFQSYRSMAQDTLVVNYKKEKELQRYPNGEINYTNHKRSLTYFLNKINI